MLTPTEAQQFLAECLLEKLVYNQSYDCVTWWTTFPILETEWLEIARQIKEKMTDEQFYKFKNSMHIVQETTDNQPFDFERFLSTANYVFIATAMSEAGIKL